MPNKLKPIFFFLVCLALSISPFFAQAQDFFGPPPEERPITTTIARIYWFGVAIVGLVAVVVLVAAGIMYIQSHGSEEAIKKAKELFGGAIAGLLLLLFSHFILRAINPDLVRLREPILKVEVCRTEGESCIVKEDGEKEKPELCCSKLCIEGKCAEVIRCPYYPVGLTPICNFTFTFNPETGVFGLEIQPESPTYSKCLGPKKDGPGCFLKDNPNAGPCVYPAVANRVLEPEKIEFRLNLNGEDTIDELKPPLKESCSCTPAVDKNPCKEEAEYIIDKISSSPLRFKGIQVNLLDHVDVGYLKEQANSKGQTIKCKRYFTMYMMNEGDPNLWHWWRGFSTAAQPPARCRAPFFVIHPD